MVTNAEQKRLHACQSLLRDWDEVGRQLQGVAAVSFYNTRSAAAGAALVSLDVLRERTMDLLTELGAATCA